MTFGYKLFDDAECQTGLDDRQNKRQHPQLAEFAHYQGGKAGKGEAGGAGSTT